MSAPGFNYVQFLQEIASEQHFEVTFVDVEEAAKSGNYYFFKSGLLLLTQYQKLDFILKELKLSKTNENPISEVGYLHTTFKRKKLNFFLKEKIGNLIFFP